jgi:steroid Delta-isomerase
VAESWPNTGQVRTAIVAHVAAVGAADVAALAALYAPDGRLHDPAGGQPLVRRTAIADHFGSVLNEPRDVQVAMIAVTGHDAAVHFRATPAGGEARDVIDTMTFDDQGLITVMRAYAD